MPSIVGNLIMGGIVLVIAALAARSLYKDKKNGKGCSGNCGHCNGCHGADEKMCKAPAVLHIFCVSVPFFSPAFAGNRKIWQIISCRFAS